MDNTKSNFKKRVTITIASIATILAVVLGVGIYNALAAAGGGGGDIDTGETGGSRFYSYAKWDDVPVYNDSSGQWEPRQGWDSASVDYFWRELNNEISDWVGLRFDAGVSASYQRQVFDEACYEALERCKGRDNQKARIVAVSVFFSNSTAQGGNVALMAQYNQRHYTDFFEKPTYDYVQGSHGVLAETYGNVLDLNTDWWDSCDQVDSLPGENWINYMWRITGVDTCGSVNGNAPYSVIAIAVNEDQMGGQYLTMTKHIEGEDAPEGSYERLIYESTQDNPCYDLAGAQFQLFHAEDNSPVIAKEVDDNWNPTGKEVPVIFTTKANGETGTTCKIKNGEYWLREITAPNKGFYLDADGDGRIDVDDEDIGLGKKVVIKGKEITVDGVKLEVYDQYQGRDRFCFEWWDKPMQDPTPIYLFKRDSLTGGLTPMPEGDGTTNGAKYRFAYYKGVYNKVEDIPGFNKATGLVDDWSFADTTAIWTTQSYKDKYGNTWTGGISLDYDSPTEGTWKYNNGFQNLCPLGTLLIVEVEPPAGYKIDSRQYLYSITDSGTHADFEHSPWNVDGSVGNGDWNNFANDYELNGDRDDSKFDWDNAGKNLGN